MEGKEKAVVVRGVCFRWREVMRGFDESGGVRCGRRWCRYSVDEGPEERRRGSVGWIVSEVMAEGCVGDMSFMRSMPMTSGRSFSRFEDVRGVPRVKACVLRRSLASGATERSSSSSSEEFAAEASEAESASAESSECRRFLVAALAFQSAQAGRGWRTSNWWRRRRVYSVPEITSSPS